RELLHQRALHAFVERSGLWMTHGSRFPAHLSFFARRNESLLALQWLCQNVILCEEIVNPTPLFIDQFNWAILLYLFIIEKYKKLIDRPIKLGI
ncbi:MAG: hypothetical protein ACRCWJ_11795, partial [Casimicrobium sp.]